MSGAVTRGPFGGSRVTRSASPPIATATLGGGHLRVGLARVRAPGELKVAIARAGCCRLSTMPDADECAGRNECEVDHQGRRAARRRPVNRLFTQAFLAQRTSARIAMMKLTLTLKLRIRSDSRRRKSGANRQFAELTERRRSAEFSPYVIKPSLHVERHVIRGDRIAGIGAGRAACSVTAVFRPA